MLMEVRGCLQGSSLFYHVDSRDGTQVVSLAAGPFTHQTVSPVAMILFLWTAR